MAPWKPASAPRGTAPAARPVCSAMLTRRRASPTPPAPQRPRLDRPRKTHRRKGDARLLRHRPSPRRTTKTKSPSSPRTRPKAWKASREGTEVALCGILTGIQRKRNKEGKLWAAHADRGSAKAAVEAHGCSPRNTSASTLLAHRRQGRARARPGAARGKRPAQDLRPGHRPARNRPRRSAFADLDTGPRRRQRRIRRRAAAAQRTLSPRKPGETEVRLRLEKPRDFSVILDVTAKVRPDKEFCAEVERICGPEPWRF